MTSARGDRLRILVWSAQGSWTSAFVRGRHEYLVPASRESEPVGPPAVRQVTPEQLAGAGVVDVVVLQGPEEFDLLTRWTGLRAGRDVPAVYVEHETPTGDVPRTRHFLADQAEIPLVHVTHFNRLMWDSGRAPCLVVEHGVPDPGFRYTGEERRAGVVFDEPVRWGRAAGTDLLTAFAEAVPLDVYGSGVEELATHGGRICSIGDLGREERFSNLARRRMYLHTARWTSLGSPLIEAMMLGMPVVAVAGTEAPRAVPPEAGFVSADLDELTGAVRVFLTEEDLAHRMGKFAREFALANYGLEAFLYRWDVVLERVRGGNG